MPYFTRDQDKIERACKVVADVTCAALLAVMLIACFGWVGFISFVLLEAALLSVDFLVPSSDDDISGAVVR